MQCKDTCRGAREAVNNVIQTVSLHQQAPPKPLPGAACNGCGVCCAAEPCPLGAIAGRGPGGACRALLWEAEQGRYFCGLVRDPGACLAWLPAACRPWAARLAARWIAAGSGCDSDAREI